MIDSFCLSNSVGEEYALVEQEASDLNQLSQFVEEWKKPNAEIKKLWERYRLLPLQQMYLIAAQYAQKQSPISWAFTTRYTIITDFDNKLQFFRDNMMTRALFAALKIQKNIVVLQYMFAILDDELKTCEEKQRIYTDLKTESPHLHEEVSKKLAFVLQVIGVQKNEKSEQELYSIACLKAVVKKILDLYRDGYSDFSNEFFKHLRIDKSA